MWVKVVREFYKSGVEYKKELDLIKKENKYNGKIFLFKKKIANHILVEKSDYATIRILRKKTLPRILSVSAILIYKNQILLHKRSQMMDTYPGYYHVFGGLVQEINLKDAIKREIFEESGLRVKRCKRLGLYFEETGIVSVVFKCIVSGKIKNSIEGEVEIMQNKKYKLTPMAEYLLKLNSPYSKEKYHYFG